MWPRPVWGVAGGSYLQVLQPGFQLRFPNGVTVHSLQPVEAGIHGVNTEALSQRHGTPALRRAACGTPQWNLSWGAGGGHSADLRGHVTKAPFVWDPGT